MLIRKIKNKLYLIIEKHRNKWSYIDVNAKISQSAKIFSSQLHGCVNVGERSVIYNAMVSGNIIIGKNTTLWGPNIQILAIKNSITIGNFCSIARDVTIQEYFHDHQKLTTYFIGRNIFGEPIENEVLSKGNIEIGSDVWIGTGVQIMSGVKIGHGVVVGANSVITKDIPPYAIVGGVPAKIIKYRFSQTIIDELLLLKWWNWDIEKIKQNKELFSVNLSIELIKKNER